MPNVTLNSVSWYKQLLSQEGTGPSPGASSPSGKVQGSQEMRLNSILLLKACARGDVFLSVFIWPWHGRAKCLLLLRQTLRVPAQTQCPVQSLCFWCLVFCSCTLLASVCACLCARFCHFIATRMVWPQDCSESTPLFSTIKWSWSLKHGEACCIVQCWVVSKM